MRRDPGGYGDIFGPCSGAVVASATSADGCAKALAAAYADLSAEAALALAIHRDFTGRVALVSSFGAESVVLLDMVARIDPRTPVIFVDTGKLFAETGAYLRSLTARLGLRDVRIVTPEGAALAAEDPDGDLHARDPDACCNLRKVRPLEDALDGFELWITGRKRHQATTRAGLAVFETDGPGRLKLNPLAGWSMADVAAYVRRRDLPAHPLVAQGYLSIGCAPCTTPVKPGEDPRAGRWRDRARTECGIHLVDGRLVPASRQGA